ncbi:hypothetical protein ACO9S2_02085 [Nitrospira sp. NS4]|uniref:hypothetical protein n=1 Tax=Nitrospira sp. NS4 TaxID=3414498 RepID=UPI003C2AE56A
MITEVRTGTRGFRGRSYLWTIGLLLCVVTATGCPRMVSLDYQPSNPLRGQGTVGTAPFHYQASDEHRVRPRQVESNPSSKTELFLTKEIGVFFSDALRLELGRSGYTVSDSSDRVVSGTITRFYLDWRSDEDRSFELAADYTVQSGERTLFSWRCSAVETGPNRLVQDGILIRKGVADCMRRFIEAAQAERIL